MTKAPDLEKFRLQIASLKTARGDERIIIASIINEMMRAMRAPGNDDVEAAAIIAELDLGTLSELHDENAIPCRAEAVETLLAMGYPHSLGIAPDDAAYAEEVRRPSFVRCPKCRWTHKGSKSWLCDCMNLMDTFASRGLCKRCGKQWKETACPGCDQWSPHADFYVYGQHDAPEGRLLHARCPKCSWAHRGLSSWKCSCGQPMNTFATRGLCTHCNHQWSDTRCPSCMNWSPHVEWYAYGKPG